MMPYWRLTATEEAKKKLKTKGGPSTVVEEPTGLILNNQGIMWVLMETSKYNGDEQCPFIDETGITEPIDIRISAVMTDMSEVSRELRKKGLILEKVKKEFKVLVIREGK
jgi:hypothetical protein